MNSKAIIPRTLFLLAVSLLSVLSVSGQCRYCNSYEDFLNDKWQPLDTVYCKGHSKTNQFLWGSSDYKLNTGDAKADKILKKSAFAVMRGDDIYINCRNLRHEKAGFGKGYCKAACIGDRELLFTNRYVSREETTNQMIESAAVSYAFGLVGSVAYASIKSNKLLKNKVCYIITSGANEKGRYDIELFDDREMDKALLSRELLDLHKEYYAEKNKAKRRLAVRILPILMQAGIIEKE